MEAGLDTLYIRRDSRFSAKAVCTDILPTKIRKIIKTLFRRSVTITVDTTILRTNISLTGKRCG